MHISMHKLIQKLKSSFTFIGGELNLWASNVCKVDWYIYPNIRGDAGLVAAISCSIDIA